MQCIFNNSCNILHFMLPFSININKRNVSIFNMPTCNTIQKIYKIKTTNVKQEYKHVVL